MASTAVHMLAVDPCRKIMVFNTDLGIDSDTDTEVVNSVNGAAGKRVMSETEDDHEKGHIKKRRKQSKPVRIASSESHSDGENYDGNGQSQNLTTDLKLSSSEGRMLAKNAVNNSQTTNVMEGDRQCDVKKDAYQSPNKSHQSQEDLSSSDDSLLPINLSNSKNTAIADFIGVQLSDGNQNLPFEKSDDFAGCTYQESPSNETGHEKDCVLTNNTSSSPLSLVQIKSIHGVNSVRHTSSPLRIFNPEAFCDLCNKEFCNKYFLKTHKANKHGIYSENSTPNIIDAFPSLPFINYFSNASETLPFNSSISRAVLRKPSLSQPAAVFLQKQPNAPPNGNTRAFCNICQREFCNKYFVRRHKAKIHGVIDISFPDTPPGDIQEYKNHNSMDLKIYGDGHDKCDDLEIYGGVSEQLVSSGSMTDEGEKPESKSCDKTLLEFINERNNQGHSLNRDIESDESLSCGVVGTNTGVSRNVSPLAVSNTHSYQQDDQTDRMKRNGVLNSEAFCDICSKEYCNKYFLRTHKMKSHGILQTESDKRDDRTNISDGGLNQCYNQTVPLNLIVSDQGIDKLECDNKDVENGIIFCKTCGQRFKNMFLLKMHTSYMHPLDVHGKVVINEEMNNTNDTIPKVNTLVKSDSADIIIPNDDEKCYKIEASDENSIKIFKCEICLKTYDSASLEAHIETEHGNLLDEVAAIGEENSDSQVFTVKHDCSSCQKSFQTQTQLNQHIIECHSGANEKMQVNNITTIKAIKELEDTPKGGSLQNMYSAHEIQPTPTSSFCEICKKELCNKYFMKTHMQRMHGISIDNGAHIGGVVCDICNKELCSKYFLRVHKQNSHGIVDEILGLDVSRNQSPGTDTSLRPIEQNDLNNRYFSHFTEVCTICSRRFRSMKWLKAHLLNDHGDEGKEKWKDFQSHYDIRNTEKLNHVIQKRTDSINFLPPNLGIHNSNLSLRSPNEGYVQITDSTSICQTKEGVEDSSFKSNVFTTIFNGKNTTAKQYHCSYCPFSTSILAFLFVHERTHVNGSNLLLDQKNTLQCKLCSMTFDSKENYEKHSITHSLSEATGSTWLDQLEQSSKSSSSERPKTNDPEDSEKFKEIVLDKDVFHHKSEQMQNQRRDVIVLTRHDQADGPTSIEPQQEYSRGQNESSYLGSIEGAPLQNCKTSCNSYEKQIQESEVNDINEALAHVKQSLEFIANKIDIPISFSVPQTNKNVIMQPFVLEDSGETSSSHFKRPIVEKSFLSSIVFLPVKERLTDSVTVSFRLTPT